ncbi:hypothetical protein ACFSTE_17375 [Aquimarina hainanensis]|uniref:Uncharacterized protein n=1 Tax=Aquimarina hainanensis TaxID=1578017 RepID=A0ABW5NBW9_9FLAO
MIVWSGRGIFSAILFILTLVGSLYILPKEYDDYGFVIAAFSAALFSWYFGKKWNIDNAKIIKDKTTGKLFTIKNQHTLFWIPMQYWGALFSILGIIILIQNAAVLYAGIASFILISLVVITYLKKPKTNTEKKETTTSTKKNTTTTEVVSDLKKESTVKKEFKPSDHTKFMPK